MTVLAQNYVEFAIEHDAEVRAAIDAIGKQLTAMGESATRAGTIFAAAMKAQEQAVIKTRDAFLVLQKSAEAAVSAINSALTAATATITGFVTKGLAASNMGQILGAQMELLSRTIAGLFGPEIRKVIDLVQQFTTWINSLTDAQRESIVHWVEAAAAALAVSVIFPRLVSGIRAVVSAVYALTTAIVTGLSATGIGALIPLIGLLIEGLAALFVGTEAGRSVLASLWEILKPIAAVVGELAGLVGSALKDAFAAVADVVAALLPLLRPLISFWTEVARVIVNVLLGPLRAVAALLHLIAKGIAAITGAKLPSEEEKNKARGDRRTLPQRIGGPESFESVYQRFQAAALNTMGGKDKQDIANDWLQQIAANTAETHGAVKNIKPAVV